MTENIILMVIIAMCILFAIYQYIMIVKSEDKQKQFLANCTKILHALESKEKDEKYYQFYNDFNKRLDYVNIDREYKIEHLLTKEQIEYLGL